MVYQGKRIKFEFENEFVIITATIIITNLFLHNGDEWEDEHGIFLMAQKFFHNQNFRD